MPFVPFTSKHSAVAKGSSLHGKSKGTPKPTPAGPGGQFDPDDSPGMDENGDGVYGKPVKRSPNPKLAMSGLKAAAPKTKGKE